MLLLRLVVVSFLCIVCFGGCRVECHDEQAPPADRTTDRPTVTQSSIYNIQRLAAEDKLKAQKQQEQRATTTAALFATPPSPSAQTAPVERHEKKVVPAVAGPIKATRMKKFKNSLRNSYGLNKKLLNKLGFTKVRAPNSHNRKRLAIESRRHASPDDSHMFIIKLPPNLYYYTSPKAGSVVAGAGAAGGVGGVGGAGTGASAAVANSKNTLLQQADKDADPVAIFSNNGNKVSFPFSSNGKPARVYHWNLPIIKKMLENKQHRFPKLAHRSEPSVIDQLTDIRHTPTWSKPWENDTVDKAYGKAGLMVYKKSLKRKSPSYYAPVNAVNKNSFNKYFSGNGKPRGLFIIKENHKKPLYYKNIVS